MKNYGINIEKELREQSPEDWLAGESSLKPLIRVPLGKRSFYLPEGEVQKGAEDTMDCASRAPHNIIEMSLLYGIVNEIFSKENIKWLFDKEYAFYDENENIRVEVSDAFTAILSGTTELGNSLKAPLDSIRKNGLIPKKNLPLLPDMTLAQYLRMNRITTDMIDLGKDFASRFVINYDKMLSSEFRKKIIEDCIVVGGYAWKDPVNGEYPVSDEQPNHAFVLYELPHYLAFDNYTDLVDGDFTKKIASDYKFLPYGYRIFISHEVRVSRSKKNWFMRLLSDLINALCQK
jgi:hypothetical protein